MSRTGVKLTWAEREAHRMRLCAARIADPTKRACFVDLLTRGNELAAQSSALRVQAWTLYRDATGYDKGDVAGKYGKYA